MCESGENVGQNRARGYDNDFIRRVYRTVLWFSGLIFILLCTTLNAKLVANYAIGALISAGMFWTQAVFVRRMLSPGQKRRGRAQAAILNLSKFGAIMIILYLLLHFNYFHPIAFLGGLVMVKVVILLKVLGRAWAKRSGDAAMGRSS